jgi:hypothetical protein
MKYSACRGRTETCLDTFEINPAARRHRKIIFGSRFANPIGCANSSEGRLSEGRNSAPPRIHPGPKKTGKRSSDHCSVRGAGRSIPSQISHDAEPVLRVYSNWPPPTVSVVPYRGRDSREIGVDIKASRSSIRRTNQTLNIPPVLSRAPRLRNVRAPDRRRVSCSYLALRSQRSPLGKLI